jgi:hypothetical protein
MLYASIGLWFTSGFYLEQKTQQSVLLYNSKSKENIPVMKRKDPIRVLQS